MRNKTARLMIAGFVAAAMVLPAPRASAWIAMGGWHPHVAIFHPAPCYGGVAAAAVAGMAVGAAMASRPIVVAPSPTVVVAPPATVEIAPPIVGSTTTVLPAGCKSMVVNGSQYYQTGSTWYHPAFGNNGVYYTVVAAP